MFCCVEPAAKTSSPPFPTPANPTVTSESKIKLLLKRINNFKDYLQIDPPLPLRAEPEPMYISPLFPIEAVPELSTK